MNGAKSIWSTSAWPIARSACVIVQGGVAPAHDSVRYPRPGRPSTTRRSVGSVSGTTCTTSLADAGTVELSGGVGQAFFEVRAGIIADQAALKAQLD